MTDTLTPEYAAAALAILDETIVTLNKRRHEFVAVRIAAAMDAERIDQFEFGVTASNPADFRITGDDVPDGILGILTSLQYADFEDLPFAVYDSYDHEEDASVYFVHYDNVLQSILGTYPNYPQIGA